MTGDLDPTIRRILMPRSGPPVILILLLIAVAAYGLITLYEPGTEPVPSPPSDAPPVATMENWRAPFDDLKRQIEQSSQSATNEMSARKADLEKLADQISALADKVDAMQKSNASSAEHAEIRPDISQSPQRRSQHLVAVHRKPMAAAPPSPIPTAPTPTSSFPPLLGPQSGGQ
jgi:uncharacterized coiled-coil protein SlyX